MPAGRPSKYKPEYCEQIISHMTEGASATSFAATIGVSRETISEWCRVHEEFSVAFTRGKAACLAWWENAARISAIEGKGSAPVIIFGLKNMGAEDWHDKREVEHSGGMEVTTKDQRDAAIAAALRANSDE